jgi:PTS system glucitol/sorbitol-specific IIA component
MTTFIQSTIVEVGPEVPELLEGGILILYALGAPPELAEVSVLHVLDEGPTADVPPVGAMLRIGTHAVPITAVGSSAWHKVSDIGHVVINFNGSDKAERPGEICVDRLDTAALAGFLVAGMLISIDSE